MATLFIAVPFIARDAIVIARVALFIFGVALFIAGDAIFIAGVALCVAERFMAACSVARNNLDSRISIRT